MKRKIFTLIAMLLIATASFAQNFTAAQVKQRINAMASATESMTCDFTQTKTMKMFRNPIVSYGSMCYAKPNKLRWEYTSPYCYTFVLNGQTVWLKNQKGSNKIDVAQSKMFKEITRIMMSSVLGSCLNNSRDFKVLLKGSGRNWSAVLTPKRNPMKQMFSQITLYFDMSRNMVHSVRMVEKNGDATLITLKNTKTNVPLNAKIFSIH